MSQESKHTIGFWTMILLGINAIIGSGIFLLPGKVMQLVGNWSIAVYLFVTLLVLSIAWCFAQCSALFNRSGGAYIYAKEAFGDFVGFEIGLMRWVVGMMAWASIVVGFVTAFSSICPEVLNEPFRSLFIFSVLGSLGLLNITGIKIFKHLNNVVTIAKLMPLILFVLVGVFYINQHHYTPLIWQELENETFGSAALIIFYAFGGFETLVVAAGDMKNPKKNLPSAVMIVISFCSFLYFMIQLISIGVLGEALATSEIPISDVAETVLGDLGKWFVSVVMLISIGGINISASFITPRSGVALAEDGMIPRWIGYRGRFNTPVSAILLTTFLTGILAISCNFAQLAIISVVSRFVQYISTCLAIYVLRHHLNPEPTFYKQVALIFIPTFALVGMGWLLMQATFSQLILGFGALVLGVPLYYLQRKKELSEQAAGEIA